MGRGRTRSRATTGRSSTGSAAQTNSSRSRATRSCRDRRASPAYRATYGSFKVVVRDLSASIGAEYFFDVQKVNKPGLPFKGGVVFNQAVTPTQPIFSFEGTGKASDYRAIVQISPSESLTLQGDQVVSGPAGVIGSIVGSPDGSFRALVSDPASRSARNSPLWWQRSTFRARQGCCPW